MITPTNLHFEFTSYPVIGEHRRRQLISTNLRASIGWNFANRKSLLRKSVYNLSYLLSAVRQLSPHDLSLHKTPQSFIIEQEVKQIKS